MICIFKCPSCGDQMRFSIEEQKLVCDTCQSMISVEEYDMESVSFDGGMKMDAGVNQYQCPSCNAVVFSADYSAKMKCAYCQSELAAFGNGEGELSPEKIIPFRIDEKGAKQCFYKWWMSHESMPEYKEEKMKPTFQNIYVPVWLVDAKVDACMTATLSRKGIRNEEEQYSMMTPGQVFEAERKQIQREKKYAPVIREIEVVYDKIPNHASYNFSKDRFHGIEPYNYEELEDFTAAYLSGHAAERYYFEPKDVIPDTIKRVRKYGETQCKRQIMAYAGLEHNVQFFGEKISAKPEEILYALVPVWVCNYYYKGKRHLVYINGQTGKADGEILVEGAKSGREKAGIFCANLALCYAICMLFFAFWGIGSSHPLSKMCMPVVIIAILSIMGPDSLGGILSKMAAGNESLKMAEDIEFRRRLKLDVRHAIVGRFIGAIAVFFLAIIVRSFFTFATAHSLASYNFISICLGSLMAAVATAIFIKKRRAKLMEKEEVEYTDYLEPSSVKVLKAND